MKRPIFALVALALAGCGTKNDGTAIPVLQPVPSVPGRYFDQGVSAWHYVHVQGASEVAMPPLMPPTTGPQRRAQACPADISRQVCEDWIRNGRKRR
jgi:hypothetical protein